jgi:hypothetical protein
MPAGASLKSEAATLFAHYYNVYMEDAMNKGINDQNSPIPSIETRGINLQVAAITRFDNKIQTIKFPKSDKTALKKVLHDDQILVALDQTLALNTASDSNYNSLAPGVVTATANSTVAINSLAKMLGLKR